MVQDEDGPMLDRYAPEGAIERIALDDREPDAVKFDVLTYDEFLTRGLKVADATSVSLARDNNLDMIVFNLSEPGTIGRVVKGEKIGTTLSRD